MWRMHLRCLIQLDAIFYFISLKWIWSDIEMKAHLIVHFCQAVIHLIAICMSISMWTFDGTIVPTITNKPFVGQCGDLLAIFLVETFFLNGDLIAINWMWNAAANTVSSTADHRCLLAKKPWITRSNFREIFSENCASFLATNQTNHYFDGVKIHLNRSHDIFNAKTALKRGCEFKKLMWNTVALISEQYACEQ